MSAAHTWASVGFVVGAGSGGGTVEAESSRVRSAGDSQSLSGFQICRKPIRQAIEMSDAPMSTIHGLMKFEMTNCGTANDTPVTRIAGQISIMPRQPANAHTTQNGTISENNGSWRPTMAPSRKGSSPVTLARPAIGVPSAPKATGAVLAMSERPDAASGEKPSPIRIAPVTATGVPKPDAPSKKAPNEKAMRRSCSLRSAVTPPMVVCRILNAPFSTVSR